MPHSPLIPTRAPRRTSPRSQCAGAFPRVAGGATQIESVGAGVAHLIMLTASLAAFGCEQGQAASARVAAEQSNQVVAAASTPQHAPLQPTATATAALSASSAQGTEAVPTATAPSADAQNDDQLAAETANSTSPRQPRADAPRVYAKTRNVWIRGKPTSKTQWIGFLWIGNSVKLKSSEPVPGPGCREGYYAVEPRGYVCVDGERATLDPEDPVLQGLYPTAPNPAVPTPHPHYGESVGTPRYLRLPTPQAQSRREWDSRLRKARIAEARNGGPIHESLVGLDLTPAPVNELNLPVLPRTLQMDHRQLIPRSAVAWTEEVEHDGRTWLLTDDWTWVPKDRVKPYDPIAFEGVHLDENVKLPLANFREENVPKFQRNADGSFSESGQTFERLGWIQLTGKTAENGEYTFHQTIHGDWLREDLAVVPKLREKTPWGTPIFDRDTEQTAPRGRGTWIDVSVLGGWLIAYEGTVPVFVTLISPGRGGVPHGKRPALETASTPTGRFKITGKFVTSTMIAPNKLVHSAVPWAQNFHGPHALHGAYWHNDWGKKKSGGCINVSPTDGRWLFQFTEPRIPEGWHGVRWLPKKEASTTLLVRR